MGLRLTREGVMLRLFLYPPQLLVQRVRRRKLTRRQRRRRSPERDGTACPQTKINPSSPGSPTLSFPMMRRRLTRMKRRLTRRTSGKDRTTSMRRTTSSYPGMELTLTLEN